MLETPSPDTHPDPIKNPMAFLASLTSKRQDEEEKEEEWIPHEPEQPDTPPPAEQPDSPLPAEQPDTPPPAVKMEMRPLPTKPPFLGSDDEDDEEDIKGILIQNEPDSSPSAMETNETSPQTIVIAPMVDQKMECDEEASIGAMVTATQVGVSTETMVMATQEEASTEALAMATKEEVLSEAMATASQEESMDASVTSASEEGAIEYSIPEKRKQEDTKPQMLTTDTEATGYVLGSMTSELDTYDEYVPTKVVNANTEYSQDSLYDTDLFYGGTDQYIPQIKSELDAKSSPVAEIMGAVSPASNVISAAADDIPTADSSCASPLPLQHGSQGPTMTVEHASPPVLSHHTSQPIAASQAPAASQPLAASPTPDVRVQDASPVSTMYHLPPKVEASQNVSPAPISDAVRQLSPIPDASFPGQLVSPVSDGKSRPVISASTSEDASKSVRCTSPVPQISPASPIPEDTRALKHPSPLPAVLQTTHHRSPINDDAGALKHPSPLPVVLQKTRHASPITDDTRALKHPSPVQVVLQSTRHASPVPDASQFLKHPSPIPEASHALRHPSSIPTSPQSMKLASPITQGSQAFKHESSMPRASGASPIPHVIEAVRYSSPVPDAFQVVKHASPIPSASTVKCESPTPDVSPSMRHVSPRPGISAHRASPISASSPAVRHISLAADDNSSKMRHLSPIPKVTVGGAALALAQGSPTYTPTYPSPSKDLSSKASNAPTEPMKETYIVYKSSSNPVTYSSRISEALAGFSKKLKASSNDSQSSLRSWKLDKDQIDASSATSSGTSVETVIKKELTGEKPIISAMKPHDHTKTADSASSLFQSLAGYYLPSASAPPGITRGGVHKADITTVPMVLGNVACGEVLSPLSPPASSQGSLGGSSGYGSMPESKSVIHDGIVVPTARPTLVLQTDLPHVESDSDTEMGGDSPGTPVRDEPMDTAFSGTERLSTIKIELGKILSSVDDTEPS